MSALQNKGAGDSGAKSQHGRLLQKMKIVKILKLEITFMYLIKNILKYIKIFVEF